MASKIQYLPASLEVVIAYNNSMAAKFLTLTRISDTVEGIRLNGHTWWSIAWWLPREWPYNNELILKKLMVATSNGGRSLYDLLETLTPEELGRLGEYEIAASATIDKMMIAIKDAEPDQKLAKKVELLDWIAQYGSYTSALGTNSFEGKCLGCLEDPLLKPSATKILNHLGYTAEEVAWYGPPRYGR